MNVARLLLLAVGVFSLCPAPLDANRGVSVLGFLPTIKTQLAARELVPEIVVTECILLLLFEPGSHPGVEWSSHTGAVRKAIFRCVSLLGLCVGARRRV